MNKIKPLIVLLTFIHFSSFAGEKRINLYGGYVFDDKFDSYYDAYNYYNGKIKGGLQYGAGLEFLSHSDFGFEILYIGQNTTAPTFYYEDESRNTEYDLNLNYAFLAGNKYLKKEDSKFEGFLGFMLGALFANATNPVTNLSNSATKFSWGIRLGGNYFVSERVGFRLQTMLLSSVQSAGGELYFGSGGDTYGATTTSSMLQFSVSSGLIFRFVKNE